MPPDLRHWILDGHEPVAVDLMTWAQWLETANRNVAQTEVAPGVVVSTVFLGLDHRFSGNGPPILFETMVFDDYLTCDTWRYATWAEAELGHMEVVEAMMAKLKDQLPQS
jgi:hypothetical protein